MFRNKVAKLYNIKDENKILKAKRGKRQIIYKGMTIRLKRHSLTASKKTRK